MLGLRTTPGKTTVAVIVILLAAMSVLTGVLVKNQRIAFREAQLARKDVMFSVLSLNLNTNYADQGFTRNLTDDGGLVSASMPQLPGQSASAYSRPRSAA